MKKIFTLIAVLFTALSMNAQSGSQIISWTDADVAAQGTLDGKTFGEGFVATLVDKAGKMAIDANNAYFGDATSQIKFTHRLKSGAKSQSAETKLNQVELTIPSAGTLKICARTGSNSATDRNLVVTQGETELYNQVILESQAVKVKGLDPADPDKETNVYPIISVEVQAGTVILTYPIGSMNFYAFAMGDIITGIDNVIAAPAKDVKSNVTYNLSGQRVNENYKGVVIKDGKKAIQK